MKRAAFFIVVVSLLLTTPSSSWATKSDGPKSKGKETKTSPSFAFGMALGPGALIHGLGNYSAGEKKTGAILFAIELFSIGMILADNGKADNSQGLGGRATDGSMGAVGRALFAGTYLYDVFSAAGAAQRRNKRVERNSAVTFQLEPVVKDYRQPLQPTFRYTKRF